MSQPCDLGAHEARSAILRGELSPVELTVSCLERVDELNPKLNAVVARWDEVALNAARAAERELQAGNAAGVLHGLPVAIKDLQATQGLVTTYGTEFYRHHVPSEDAGIVARVKAAGGIIIGKTNIPEMSIGANTINRIFGATGNPYDPTLTCGGSSGGSAVAVAAGMAPLATGSDHGGSLRIPASFCGVVGHRATPGTVPNETRTVTQTNYSLQGPMARTVDDAALLLAAIARRDRDSRRDPMSFPLDASQFLTIEAPALEDFEIGFTQDFGGLPVSAHVRDSFAQRVEYLEERGAKSVRSNWTSRTPLMSIGSCALTFSQPNITARLNSLMTRSIPTYFGATKRPCRHRCSLLLKPVDGKRNCLKSLTTCSTTLTCCCVPRLVSRHFHGRHCTPALSMVAQ